MKKGIHLQVSILNHSNFEKISTWQYFLNILCPGTTFFIYSLIDHKQKILEVSSSLVQDTKKLAMRHTGKQDNLAEVADGSLKSIIGLSEAVKKGAGSLNSSNSEAQVMLLNSVKDVASALHDLLNARKAASSKNKQEDETLTKSAQVF